MDALIDAEMKLQRLEAAMRLGIEACTEGVPEPGPPVALADAAVYDAARMRLDGYRREEATRLAPVAAAINGCFAEAQQSIARLSDATPEQMLAAVAALEQEQAALDRQLVDLYGTAARLDDDVHRRIANTAVEAFGPLPPEPAQTTGS
jgi:hypothetical protein